MRNQRGNMSKKAVGGVVLILAAVLISLFINSNKNSSLDSFVSCLKEKGTVVYGAFWCPHCQNQKKLFGSSEKLLPYIECSTPDGKEQVAACKDKNVTSYPTWEFSGGERITGELSLNQLSEKTQCPLPNNK